MLCEDVRVIIEANSMLVLEPQKRLDFEHHLAVCDPCRSIMERVRTYQAKFASDAEFCPGESFWKDYHKRVSTEMNRAETFDDKFYRWRLRHLPAAMCQYSITGLLKIVTLGMLAVLVFLVFHMEHTARAKPNTGSYRIERDSTGMTVYKTIDHQ